MAGCRLQARRSRNEWSPDYRDSATDMKRILVINADDFGYTCGINATIQCCAAEGVLRNTTLMANGPAFDDAVAIAKANRSLSVGVHLNLTELKPVAGPDKVPTLVDETGAMQSSPRGLAAALVSGAVSAGDIRRELLAQVSKVMDCGIVPTHLDSHKHVHVLPPVLEVAIEIARRYSIPWIRNPFEDASAWRLITAVGKNDRRVFLKQYAEANVIKPLQPVFRHFVRRSGLRTPDGFHGLSVTGLWNENVLSRLVGRLKPGVNEWMVHPGVVDRALKDARTRLLGQREVERDILLSPVWASLPDRHGFTVRGFGEELS